MTVPYRWQSLSVAMLQGHSSPGCQRSHKLHHDCLIVKYYNTQLTTRQSCCNTMSGHVPRSLVHLKSGPLSMLVLVLLFVTSPSRHKSTRYRSCVVVTVKPTQQAQMQDDCLYHFLTFIIFTHQYHKHVHHVMYNTLSQSS